MKKLLLSCLLLLSLNTYASEEGWKKFDIEGENLENVLLEGYKLAWMKGDAKGRFLQEYVLENENIESWQKSYIAIERIPYPSAETKKSLEDAKLKLSEIALSYYIESTDNICQVKHHKMSKRTNTFNGNYMVITGGFCEKFGTIAPNGEGAIVGFIEGKNFLFRVQYGWRPKDKKENIEYLPYRITPDKVSEYLIQFKKITTCSNNVDKDCN